MGTWEGAVLLEQEQENTLTALVELSRSIPRDARDSFIVVQSNDGTQVIHHALRSGLQVLMPDMEVLASEGLIALRPGARRYTHLAHVTPRGFRYYEYVRQRGMEAPRQMEAAIRDLLTSPDFPYRAASEAWANAMESVWRADDPAAWRRVGLSCREAMQQLISSLIAALGIEGADPDPQHTKNRLRTVIEHVQPPIGDTEAGLVDAAVDYWAALIPWVQAQAHPSVPRVSWEAARSAVFHTGFLMYELHRLINRRQ